MDLAKKQREIFIREQIGRSYYVLIENKSSLGNGYVSGITPNYIKVHFKQNGGKKDFVPVVIKGLNKGYVYGEIEE
ncbi:unnamed protein product [marine sediment metagenome]|uniref:TRAM domain-containing protein n=1 Tax=marine sediment metagenome TaxID=412755 RepID=X1MAH9_9ZZZZ